MRFYLARLTPLGKCLARYRTQSRLLSPVSDCWARSCSWFSPSKSCIASPISELVFPFQFCRCSTLRWQNLNSTDRNLVATKWSQSTRVRCVHGQLRFRATLTKCRCSTFSFFVWAPPRRCSNHCKSSMVLSQKTCWKSQLKWAKIPW